MTLGNMTLKLIIQEYNYNRTLLLGGYGIKE